MTQEEQIAALKREMRRMKLALAGVAALGMGGVLVAAAAPAADARFATITAERINIVEPDGIYRMVLTNGARSPGPVLEAREGAKEGERNFPFGGIVIYDRKGQEQGGFGTGAKEGVGSLAVQAIDWPGGEGGGFGEAVVSFRRIDAAGEATNGIVVNDRPPAGADPADGVNRQRIKIQNVARDAEVLLADAQGKDRIRMRVGRDGEAFMEILDAEGRQVFRAPQN